MDILTFGPGPRLLWHDVHRQDADRPATVQVEGRAVEFLHERVTLDSRMTLGDVFKLLEACTVLQTQVFRRLFAQELCAEARKGPLPQSLEGESEGAKGIEYLELCRSWARDTSANTYSTVHSAELVGVGQILGRDVPDYGRKAGERIQWAVELTPLRELLDLPVRLRSEVAITEDDIDAKDFGAVISRVQCADWLLGEVLHGVLSELSFHGGPQGQAEFRAMLVARKAEVDAGVVELIPAEEVFSQWDAPGFEALFETLGDVSTGDVRAALRRIPDDEPAGPWLDREFDRRVVVREPFRGRSGRAFRQAFRAAGR